MVKFDPADAPQMTELLGMAIGLQPTRLTQKWDLIRAQQEAVQFWDLKRQALLRQAGQARVSGDSENYARVIQAVRDFNYGLPPEARGHVITGEALRSSITSRLKGVARTEIGLPQRNRDIPLIRQVQELFTEAAVDLGGAG